jgi:hypothetical protein
LRQEQERRQQLRDNLERKKVLEENGVPEEHFLRKKRLQEFQSMLDGYKKKKEERSLDIVEKLLREDKLKRKHRPVRSASRKTARREVLTAPSSTRGRAAPDSTLPDEGGVVECDNVESSDSASDTEVLGDCEHALQDQALVTIVEPEIRGLWDKHPTVIVSPKPGPGEVGEEEASQHQADRRKASKAEILIMKKAMEKLKDSKIQEQVAAGKKFKART